MAPGPRARYHISSQAQSQSTVKESDENCISPWELLRASVLTLPGDAEVALGLSPSQLYSARPPPHRQLGWSCVGVPGPKALPASSVSSWLCLLSPIRQIPGAV